MNLLGQSGSLISPDDPWALWAVILAGVAISIYLEQAYRWAARLSGPVIALVVAMLLSNLAIMPMASPAYDAIGDYLVPTAVALLLFRASLIDIARTSRMAFVAMQIAIVATIGGSLAAGALLNWLGDATSRPVAFAAALPELTGMMAGSYTGGAVNFFAVKGIYRVDGGLTSSLLVADNFVMAAMFLAMFSLASSRFMRRRFPHPHSLQRDDPAAPELAEERERPRAVLLPDIAKALAVAVAIAAVSHILSRAIGERIGQLSAGLAAERPSLLESVARSLLASEFAWVTLISVAAATLFGKSLRRIAGAEELGAYLLYLFLFSIGLPSDFVAVVQTVPLLFVLCATIAAFNLGLTLGVGKLLGLNLEELLLASNASLGGPPTAAAMAVSLGWKRLVTPGLLIGLWGYVVGTAVGVGVAETLRHFLSPAP